jgi:DNA helicase IV
MKKKQLDDWNKKVLAELKEQSALLKDGKIKSISHDEMLRKSNKIIADLRKREAEDRANGRISDPIPA